MHTCIEQMIYTVSVETFLDNPHSCPTDSNDGGPQNRLRSPGDALELGGLISSIYFVTNYW